MVEFLAGILPTWLKIVENQEGPILRMNTDMPTTSVLGLFKEAMN
jgi:hypothetical protein